MATDKQRTNWKRHDVQKLRDSLIPLKRAKGTLETVKDEQIREMYTEAVGVLEVQIQQTSDRLVKQVKNDMLNQNQIKIGDREEKK